MFNIVVVNKMLNRQQAAHRFGIEALAGSWPDFPAKASTPSVQFDIFDISCGNVSVLQTGF